MAEHFLGLADAATITTKQFQLTERVIGDLVEHLGMGVIHGPAGTGKTFAVESAMETADAVTAVVQCNLAFQSKPTMRQVLDELVHTITGAVPAGNRFKLTQMLIELLAGPPRLLIIDEAQRLTGDALELVRHLHDHRGTAFAVLYVGGDGCWEVLSREPMLRSRIFRRLPFQPLSRTAVPALIRDFHPIYATAGDDLLLGVDDVHAHGNLRDWAVFTHTAAQVCRQTGRDHIDAAVVANAYALLGGGITD